MHKLKRYFQISLAVSRIVRLILPHSLDDVLSYSYRARLPEDPAQGSMLNKGQEHCHGVERLPQTRNGDIGIEVLR
jgi:hypothetical protein